LPSWELGPTLFFWLRQTDLAEDLSKVLKPSLLPDERAMAEIEGWVLGVM